MVESVKSWTGWAGGFDISSSEHIYPRASSSSMSAQPIMFEFWCVAEMVSMQTRYTRQHDDNNTNKVLQSCCIELNDVNDAVTPRVITQIKLCADPIFGTWTQKY